MKLEERPLGHLPTQHRSDQLLSKLISPYRPENSLWTNDSPHTTAGQFGAQFVHEISPWCGVVGDWVLDWIHQAPLQDIDYATMIVMS